jgi:hypothetical protein
MIPLNRFVSLAAFSRCGWEPGVRRDVISASIVNVDIACFSFCRSCFAVITVITLAQRNITQRLCDYRFKERTKIVGWRLLIQIVNLPRVRRFTNSRVEKAFGNSWG